MSFIENWFKRPSRPNKPPVVIPPVPIEPGIVDPPFYPSDEGIVGMPRLVAEGVNPIGMSYWRNIFMHEGEATLRFFLSVNDRLRIYTLDKISLNIISEVDLGISHTGEGCYTSAKWPHILYVPINDTMFRVHIDTGGKSPIFTFGDGFIWQCHSSYDETVHSATIKDRDYKVISWAIFNEKTPDAKFFDIKSNEPDECQVDKLGEWLFIKEVNYNRIIHISSGSERIVSNEEGALGHGDIGFGMAFGENDMSSHGGALDCIRFEDGVKRMINYTGIWNMGYFSFTNAKPGDINNQWGLLSTPTELVMVKLDNSLENRVVCQHFTEINPNWSDDEKYRARVKANLCPSGKYAIYTAFIAGKLNAYVVRV